MIFLIQEKNVSEADSIAEEIEDESLADDLDLASDFGRSEKLMNFSSTRPSKMDGMKTDRIQGFGEMNLPTMSKVEQ